MVEKNVIGKVLVLLLLFVVVSCAGSGKVAGNVYIAGNEPFTWVALEAADGTVYKISATKELEQRLRSLQGKKVEVEYTKMTDVLEGKAIAVTVVKEVNK